MSKVLGTLLIIFGVIFFFPIAIGIGGAIFGLIVGLIGAVFGILAGIFGAIIAIPAFLFELVFGGIPLMAGIAIVFFVLLISGAIAGRQRRAPKTEANS